MSERAYCDSAKVTRKLDLVKGKGIVPQRRIWKSDGRNPLFWFLFYILLGIHLTQVTMRKQLWSQSNICVHNPGEFIENIHLNACICASGFYILLLQVWFWSYYLLFEQLSVWWEVCVSLQTIQSVLNISRNFSWLHHEPVSGNYVPCPCDAAEDKWFHQIVESFGSIRDWQEVFYWKIV